MPSFNALYVTTPQAQERLGRPRGPALFGPGAYQGFERGVMLWRGETRQIYVLCGSSQAGQVLNGNRGYNYFSDTFEEGQDPGGGPGPQPGLYEPKRGFGKLWRESQRVRDCLGYATSPDETGYTIALEQFSRGAGGAPNLLLSATTPQGRVVYALYQDLAAGGCCQYFYERYLDPIR